MKQDNDTKVFSRRSFVLGALQLGVLGVLGARLGWLQLVKGQRYRTLADKNRISLKILAPRRGLIYDRLGVPLAVNDQNFRVLITPEQTEDIEVSLRALQKLIALDEEQIERAIKTSKRVAKFVPIEVKDELSWEDVSKIEVNLPDLPGLSIDVGDLRSYPFKESTAHIVGYVGLASDEGAEKDPVLSLPGFRVGKTAIEKKLDLEMRGQAGAKKVEVNVVGREVRDLDIQPGLPGRNVSLSIDSRLQSHVQNRLAQERSASAVIMDAKTGAVYALCSYPSFDPNLFTHGMSAAAWEGLLANPGHPLTNKAIAGQYPPASTFKMITAIAGLKTGVITADKRVYCPGHYEYGKDRFHCWKGSGHGSVDLVGALAMSCDTYFYELATQIGIDKIAKTARQFGLGDKLGFDLAEERPGLVPDKLWKLGRYGQKWHPGETIVASIGQGYLLSTPLQLAVMTARLVNGGYAVEPWLVGYMGQQQRRHESWPKMDVEPEHLALVKRGMYDVVNAKTGTAFGSRIEQGHMIMAGKTGTAQVKRITKAQRAAGVKNEDLPWKQRHHALFVGYAPHDNPRYVCSVVVEHGVGGSKTAAPIAQTLLLQAQKLNPARREIYSPADRAVSG